MMLPKGWARARVDELAGPNGLVSDGDWVESKDQDPDGNVRLVQLADIGEGRFRNKSFRFMAKSAADRLCCTFLEPGDVLIARMPDPIGRACVFPGLQQPAVTAVDILIWRTDGEVAEAEWFVHWVNSPEVRTSMVERAGGTTRQRIAGGRIKELVFPLPPKAEQRRIVAKLAALTVRLARARAELDRVPVLAAALRDTALADTYRELAARATSVPIQGLITTLDQGWSPKCENFPSKDEEIWAVLKTTSIQALEFRPDENKALPLDLKPRPKIEVEEGDILVTRAGPRVRCGVTCLVSKVRRKLMIADKMYRLRCKPDLAVPGYLVQMLNAPQIISLIEAMKTGISDSGLNLTQDKFLSLPIPLVSLDEQRNVEIRLQTAFARADRLEAEAARARALLDRLESAILTKAFRGELVPQDSDDEPASVLLDRIRAERAAAPKPKRGRRAAASA